MKAAFYTRGVGNTTSNLLLYMIILDHFTKSVTKEQPYLEVIYSQNICMKECKTPTQDCFGGSVWITDKELLSQIKPLA